MRRMTLDEAPVAILHIKLCNMNEIYAAYKYRLR